MQRTRLVHRDDEDVRLHEDVVPAPRDVGRAGQHLVTERYVNAVRAAAQAAGQG